MKFSVLKDYIVNGVVTVGSFLLAVGMVYGGYIMMQQRPVEKDAFMFMAGVGLILVVYTGKGLVKYIISFIKAL